MPEAVFRFLTIHPWLFYGAVFVVSFAESLALVGLVVPGAVLMFASGVVIASGGLPLAPAIHAAAVGALLGDLLSYLAGRVYGERLFQLRLFQRTHAALDRARLFLDRHGGKSIILGRFVGALRPLVPLIAGIIGMSPRRFLAAAIPGAWAWAAAYLLPGVVFGASLTVAGRVSARLTALIIVLVTLGWLLVTVAQGVLSATVRWAGRLPQPCCEWAGRAERPSVRRFPDVLLLGVFRPLLHLHQGERILLPVLVIVSVIAGGGFMALVQAVLAGAEMRRTDHAVYVAIQALRTVPTDRVMVLITELGDGFVNTVVTVVVAAVLAASGRRRALYYWITTIVGGTLLVYTVKWVLGLPRPPGAAPVAFSFPSGHAAMSLTIYGFLGMLAAVGSAPRRARYGGSVLTLSFCFLVAFSRLYLGVHWLSDVLGGWLLSAAWISLMGSLYLGLAHGASPLALPRRRIAAAALAGLVLGGGWHAAGVYSRDVQRYRTRRFVARISFDDWVRGRWRQLPACRIDMGGDLEYPLTLQFCGDPVVLRRRLESAGWRPAPPVSATSLLQSLAPDPPLTALPVLPRLHDGRPEVMRLTKLRGRRRFVLRLWPVDADIRGIGAVYMGTVEMQSGRQYVGWLTVARRAGSPEEGVRELEKDIRDLIVRRVERQRIDGRYRRIPVLLAVGASPPREAR